MCQSLPMFFIPFKWSLVSRILRNICYSSIANAYIDTSRMIWTSYTSPCLARHTYMPSRSSRSLNKRSETLDLWIWSKGKAPQNYRTKDKAKAGQRRKTLQGHKQRKTLQSWRRKRESGVSSIKSPPIMQVSVGPSSYWWLNWRLHNQMHVPTLSQNPTRGVTKGRILLMRIPMPPSPPQWSTGGGASIPLLDVGKGFPATVHCW